MAPGTSIDARVSDLQSGNLVSLSVITLSSYTNDYKKSAHKFLGGFLALRVTGRLKYKAAFTQS